MDVKIDSSQRIDDIGFGTLRLIQNIDEFCYGVDGVILADFAAKYEKSQKEKFCFDLGTGTGIIPLIISHKAKNCRIVGVEVQDNSYELARKNIKINNLEERIDIIHSNVKDINKKLYGKADFVVSNPPYMENNSALKNTNEAKTIARHEVYGKLEDFIKTASNLLKDKGKLYMVHRPSRLVDLFCFAREFKLEPKLIQFVSPKQGEIPNIVLIQFVKNGGKELRYLEELKVYGTQGEYSDEIKKIYEK
ncbi:MAG: tRNA1(Val) (adenine(37)-N6)-methyltransferase [Anaerovoracaceae bacterium]